MLKSILVVDDDVTLRNLYSDVLSEQGYLVFKAASGEEAFEKIQKLHFDLVLTDLNMKAMSGTDLLKKIKGHKKEIKVILLTSHLDFNLASKASDIGLFWYLTKPLDDVNDLVTKVAEAIGNP